MMAVHDFFYQPLPDIGLIGETRSGKDTVFNILKSMGFRVRRYAFGDKMKDSFFQTFPDIPHEPKPTRQLQQYGQSMRKIDQDVWVKAALRKRELDQQSSKRFTSVFTDIRQPNEYEAVKKLGAIIVRVEAPEEVRVKRMLHLGEKVTQDVLTAPTERFLLDFDYDYKIVNNGSRYELEKEITQLVYNIQAARMEQAN